MKRANFTLFQPQRLMSIGHTTLMVLFVWCCLGINTASAQIIMPNGAASKTECADGTTFTDDGDVAGVAGNYADATARLDTIEICPPNAWSRVYVKFTHIDIEAGDSLTAFDGDIAAMIADSAGTRIDAATGQGASQMNGAWVQAHCSLDTNSTGCITFLFETDGTNSKGSGWKADVSCSDRGAVVTSGNVVVTPLTCDIISTTREATTDVVIPAPTITYGTDSNCGTYPADEDSVLVVVTNQIGTECFSGFVSKSEEGGADDSVEEKFAAGSYKVVYTLKVDSEKKDSSTFTVQAPSLICNDNIDVPFGSACAVQLTPDDILENPCDTVTGVLEYDITIILGEGKDAVTLRTTTADGYPIITADTLAAAGMTVCNAVASVTITRTLKDGGTCSIDQSTSCTTTLTLNDRSRPFITLSSGVDTIVACNADSVMSIFAGRASAIDNCIDPISAPIESVVMDETDPCFSDNEKADTTFAVITFKAEDECGNISRITDTVTIIRPNEEHIVKVADSVRDCKDLGTSSSVPKLAIGTIQNGTFTKTGDVALSENDYVCGYILQKRDIEIPGTDCGRKIYRYWTLLDWCTPADGPSPIDTNFIEYTDTLAPVFANEIAEKLLAPDSIQLGPFVCTYDIAGRDLPTADDNCGLDKVELLKVFRIENGEDWEITDKEEWAKLDCDSFRLMYVARDLCHEQTKEDTTRQVIVIQDKTIPSAVCTDELHVSVPNTDGARIHYKDINGGGLNDGASYDACGIKSIRIRKIDHLGNEGPWGETVDIDCQDVHNKPTIEMEVTDNKDNKNTCWMTVTAEDKIAPVCGDLPDNNSYKCHDFHSGELGADTNGEYELLTGDLMALYNDKFGDPFADNNCYDNLSCGPLTPKQYYKLTELPCGGYDIDRKWTVTDWALLPSNEGTQHIDIDYEAAWTLTFPTDHTLDCGDAIPAAATAADIISNGLCDLWALEVSEKTFEVPGDICMKVERTYELINWCEYNAGKDAIVVDRNADGTPSVVNHTDSRNIGRYTYVQVMKLYATEAPSKPVIAPVDSCIVGVTDVDGQADNTPGAMPFECDAERTFSATATNCAGADLSSDHFTYIFTVDGVAEEPGVGSSFTRVVAPNTNYKVEFWVTDGCGNSSGTVQEYQFWDCKKPTPYVLHGLAIAIMQTGSIELWASDLNQGSYDNCTVKDKLQYRLFKGDPVDGPQDIDGILALDENVTFSCPVFGTQNVSFYVIDEKLNWDVVGTYVSVGTANGACTGGIVEEMGRVAGTITNNLGEKVELVNVSVNGSDNTMSTGATGEFQFDLALAGDYTITPEKNINPLNGVSTYDLVLISKHILGIQTFDNPYKYIAADVNKSGSITAFDMVQLRQLILNITSEFSNNTSWRFVDAKHEFTSNNPAAENFDEFMNINNLDGQMLNVDFIATKIGDVNGNATSNSLLGAESRTTNGTLSLNVMDRFVEAGQTVTVDFATADIAATQGYQFTLDFAGLDFVALNEGVAKANNFNTSIAKRGVLTTSWNGEATDENLFSITFTANTNGLLSELVSVNSDITTAEAYNTAGELLDVALNFNSSNVSAAFELSQNTPNPFNGETLIGFNLPQAGTATLKVMDIQGKVLTVISKEGVKGYNQVTLNAKTLGATGVLYYQLESADNIATKKMIIID